MSNRHTPSRKTLDQIKQILRADLRLGDAPEIPDDAPLFGSDLDLDSLDILLIVSSIEKRFGVNIPNDEIDRSAFESVTTLSLFAEDHWGKGKEPGDDT